MTTLDFLKLVWPSTGQYLVLIPTTWVDKTTGVQRSSFKHFAHTTIESAAQHAHALAHDRQAPQNVYFALGSVKEDLTKLTKVQRDQDGKKVRGKHKSGHDNTQAIKAYWLDLDVKADPKAYATQQEAAEALIGFCKTMKLPKPTVTSSGGGLHVYWPLTEELDPEKWQHYANILKGLTHSWGLRADDSRTADRASILRPVGTYNWKTGNARPVQVVVQGAVVDTSAFLKQLAYLAETINLPPVKASTPVLSIQGAPLNIAGQPLVAAIDVQAMVEAASNGASYAKADPRKVVAKCRQLSWQAANQALVSEPSWYTMIACLRHAEDGLKAIHFMSKNSPVYDQNVTITKIQQLEDNNVGPSLCTTFESHNPGGCDGCPFRGKIKTPLQIVREMEAAPPPVLNLATSTGTVQVTMIPPPAPFKRVQNPASGVHSIAMTMGEDDGSEVDVVIYDNDLYPIKLIYDERSAGYAVVIRSFIPNDGWREFQVPTGIFYDKRKLSTTLGNIGVFADAHNIDHVVNYMLAYMRDLQKAAASSVIYAQLGWRLDDTKFILPDRVITANAVEHHAVSKNMSRALSWEAPRGDLDVWKKIVATYERPGMEAHQFGFGVGFASPLFKFTSFHGMIVSMVGNRGAGKSSAALSANSIWGQPMMGWGDLGHDTKRAFWQKLGVLNNLPATYDEHTNLDGETVSDLCYAISKGQGRQRLESTGEAAENHGNWQLMMLMTGNRSLNSRLATAKADSAAESARVFEYHVPENTLTKAEADSNWGPGGAIFTNFGLAAEPYARQILQNQDWARDRVKHWVGVVDKMASVSSGERFWSAGVACVLTGFELANAAGLTNADIQRLLNFGVRTIIGMRAIVTENTRSPVNILGDYMNGKLRGLLAITSDVGGNGFCAVQHAPSDQIRIRLERHTGKMFIDRADFRRFCSAAQIDAGAVQADLELLGVLKKKDVKLVLGRGTQWRTTQTICWQLDADHPAMAGIGDVVPVNNVAAQGSPIAGTGQP